jgi:GntR family transcriptional repressor for pyruvate dehydrogenase complex
MFKKAKDTKLYEEVVRQIRHLIITSQLKDGDMLPSEEELSKKIGVSRPTVREGLRVLGLMGLVETKRGRGTCVRVNNQEAITRKMNEALSDLQKDILYVLEIDRLYEPSMAKLAAEKATEQDIKKLEHSLGKMEKALRDGETGQEETIDFHKCLVDILDNPVLKSIFEILNSTQKETRTIGLAIQGVPEQILKQHYNIYEAIKNKNPEKAYYYMEDHLESMMKVLSKVLINRQK